MRIKIIILAIIISLTTSSALANDFRKITWGMNKAEVKKAESFEIKGEAEDFLLYHGKVLRTDVKLAYLFSGNKLDQAAYTFDNDIYTKVFDLFKEFKRLLIKKYGNPSQEEEEWMSSEIKKIYDKKTAVLIGMVSLCFGWKTENTKITLAIIPADYIGSKLAVMYSKRKSETEEKELQKKSDKRKMEDL